MDKRKKKTSYHQYILYIKMLEEDNIFRSGILTRNVDINNFNSKWDELAEELNNCGSGPILSTEEWKKRLNDWKNSTRAKYRKIIDQPSNEAEKTLSPLENKALSLWGSRATKIYRFDEDANSDDCKQTTLSTSIDQDIQEIDSDCMEQKEDLETPEPSCTHFIDEQDVDKLENCHNTSRVDDLEEDDLHPKKRIRYETVEELNNKTDFIESIIRKSLTSSDMSDLVAQIKRIADIKEERLKFEIAKFQFRNPGFKYDYKGVD